MADFEQDDHVREALSGFAAGSERSAGTVLEDLRPALGRARLRRRLSVVVGGIALRSPTEAQQVEIAGETPSPEEVPPITEASRVTSSATVVPPSTAAVATTAVPSETAAAVATSAPVAVVPGDPDSSAEQPGSSPDPTVPPPAVTTPPTVPVPADPPTTVPTSSAQSVVIQVPDAGTISVGYTASTMTEVGVTTLPGSSYEIEDRTEHEVKVEFEGNRSVEVEIHLEDGEITYQIDSDDPDS